MTSACAKLDLFMHKVAMAKVRQAAFKPADANLGKRQSKEIGLWKMWNENGRQPEHLEPLLDSLAPIINKSINKFKGVEIPHAALEAEALKQAIKALRSYDPARAQLNTHLESRVKLNRYVKQNQNMGKIPDAQRDLITPYRKAKSQLEDELGYLPGPGPLATRLSELTGAQVTAKRVKQLQLEMKGSLVASELAHDPSEIVSSKEMQALGLMQYDHRLKQNPLKLKVFQMTHGFGGYEPMKPTQISAALKIRPSKVSKIRNKLKTYLQETVEVM